MSSIWQVMPTRGPLGSMTGGNGGSRATLWSGFPCDVAEYGRFQPVLTTGQPRLGFSGGMARIKELAVGRGSAVV